MTITITYVIDSLYMDKKRYPKKRDAQLNIEMHSFLYHTDFGGSDYHRKKTTLVTSWRDLCIFLQWAPSLLFEQLLLRIFISHLFPIVFTWWHTRQWLWNTPFPTKKSHTISIPTLHRLWLKKQVVSKKVLGANKIALFTHIWIL